jgi:hypothetical protein
LPPGKPLSSKGESKWQNHSNIESFLKQFESSGFSKLAPKEKHFFSRINIKGQSPEGAV